MSANFEEKLINCVYQYEILFDISHQHYYDNVRKENAWEEIAETLKLQGKKSSSYLMFY